MRFLDPWFLSIALISWLIIFLIYRRPSKDRAVQFSGVMFIDSKLTDNKRSFPWKAFFDLLPLALLAIAGAKPVVEDEKKTILLDASLSTAFLTKPGSTERVFDVLRQRAMSEIQNSDGLIEIIDACTLEPRLFNQPSDAINFITTLEPKHCEDRLRDSVIVHRGNLLVYTDKSIDCDECVPVVVKPFSRSNIAISRVNVDLNSVYVELRCTNEISTNLQILLTDKTLQHSVTCSTVASYSFQIPEKPAQIALESGGFNGLDDLVDLNPVLRLWFSEKQFDFLLKRFVLDNSYDIKISRLDHDSIESNSIYFDSADTVDSLQIAEFVPVDPSISSFLTTETLKVYARQNISAPNFHEASLPLGYVENVPALFFPEKNSIYFPFNLPKSVEDNQVKILLLNAIYWLGKIKSDVFFVEAESFPDDAVVRITSKKLTGDGQAALWQTFVKLALITGFAFFIANLRG